MPFDESVLHWMGQSHRDVHGDWHDWERVVENQIMEAVAPLLEDYAGLEGGRLTMTFSGDRLRIQKEG